MNLNMYMYQYDLCSFINQLCTLYHYIFTCIIYHVEFCVCMGAVDVYICEPCVNLKLFMFTYMYMYIV